MNFEELARKLAAGPQLAGSTGGVEVGEIERIYQSTDSNDATGDERDRLVGALQRYVRASVRAGGNGRATLVAPVVVPTSEGEVTVVPFSLRIAGIDEQVDTIAAAMALREDIDALVRAAEPGTANDAVSSRDHDNGEETEA